MTFFNPEGKDALTYRDCLDPAMKITDVDDALQYFRAYVAYIQNCLNHEPHTDGKTAAEIARINLGYYAGYYDNETRKRVERLFSCAHPIFGKATKGKPTAEAAFDLGYKMGANAKLSGN